MRPNRKFRPQDGGKWLQSFQSEMNQLFQRFYHDTMELKDDLLSEKGSFTPAFNIKEKRDKYLVEAEIPGMNHDQIDIEVKGHTLLIQGEKQEEDQTEEDETHIVERRFGSFQRSFTLPEDAVVDDITAESDSGVLKIHIPKTENSGDSKKIKVNHS